MKKKEVTKYGDLATSILGDVISITTGLPTGTLSAVFKKLIERKIKDGSAILHEEIEKKDIISFGDFNEDEVVQIFYRYFISARDNRARLNMRLMAKVISGQISKNLISAEKFDAFSSMIESLSRDEIIAISHLYKCKGSSLMSDGNFYPSFATGYHECVRNYCIPKYFPTEDHLLGVLSGAMRSGLVMQMSGDNAPYLGLAFVPTPMMDELMSLISIEDALVDEGVGSID